MFSILQKPQDTVNAEDLETLQNELERRLVDVVTQKWALEREIISLNSSSPDLNNSTSISSTTNALSTPNQPPTISGKLRNSYRLNQIEGSENSSDGFKGSVSGSNNNGATGSASGTNSTEDSVSSEGSIVSSLTSNTANIANVSEPGSQIQTTSSANTPNKRSHKSSGDRPSKRFRQNSSNSLSNTSTNTKRPPHSKHRSKILPSKFRSCSEESRQNKKKPLKNGAPDKLWPFVEQFCATPTQEQIEELDEMIKSMDNDKDYFKIPTLGKKESTTKESPTKVDNSTTPKNSKKVKSRSGDEEANLGALTQRLVSSLIEDEGNAIADESKLGSEAPQSAKKKSSKSKGGKSIDMNSAKNLERRIRQELEEYDILDQQDDIPYTSEDDDVLRELVASQQELLSIQRQNKDSMQRLLKKAKRHRELEIEREKLREANSDVISAYHKLIQAKQRKRNPTKKEKDAAWKALKVQDAIFKKCDELYLSGLN